MSKDIKKALRHIKDSLKSQEKAIKIIGKITNKKIIKRRKKNINM